MEKIDTLVTIFDKVPHGSGFMSICGVGECVYFIQRAQDDTPIANIGDEVRATDWATWRDINHSDYVLREVFLKIKDGKMIAEF